MVETTGLENRKPQGSRGSNPAPPPDADRIRDGLRRIRTACRRPTASSRCRAWRSLEDAGARRPGRHLAARAGQRDRSFVPHAQRALRDLHDHRPVESDAAPRDRARPHAGRAVRIPRPGPLGVVDLFELAEERVAVAGFPAVHQDVAREDSIPQQAVASDRRMSPMPLEQEASIVLDSISHAPSRSRSGASCTDEIPL